MKPFGSLLLLAAIAALLFGLNIDTSVSTEMGGRVHNLGLMSEKQNIIIVGGAMLVAGALLLALSTRGGTTASEASPDYRKCPSCAELVKNEAKVCRFCQRDLPSLSQLASKEAADRKTLEEARHHSESALREAEAKLPQGTCPNCYKTIPAASLECKHCHASFGPGSAWRVIPRGEA
jgi:hypothetical protein